MSVPETPTPAEAKPIPEQHTASPLTQPKGGKEMDMGNLFTRTLQAHAVERLSPKASPRKILGVVSAVEEYRPDVNSSTEEVATTARGVASGQHEGAICAVMATVAEITRPEEIIVGSTQIEYVDVIATDRSGDTIPLLPVVDAELASKLLDAGRRGAPVRLTGVVTNIPRLTTRSSCWGVGTCNRDNLLMLSDVESAYSHLDAMAATAEERRLAAEKIAKAKGNVRALLSTALTRRLGIVGAEGTPIAELLDWIVLQAFGCGRMGHTPGTLHVIVVGPPGEGKKLLSLAAQILNPVSEELMPGRVSAAGLMGPLLRTKSGWQMGTGALGRASGGLTVMQDVHAWSDAQVRELAPVLQHVIEDGEVRLSGMAGGQTRAATTALLLDANRTTDILGIGRLAPILDALPLLTRLDIAVEIPGDLQRAWETGAAIVQASVESVSHHDDRVLKAVVATLRDRRENVDLGPISSELESAYRALWEEYQEFLEAYPGLASSLSRRMAVSMRKMTSAAARAGDRDVATKEDVYVARAAGHAKLEFMANNVVQMSTCPSQAPDVLTWLTAQSGVLSPKELAEKYTAQTGNSVSERTIRRALTKKLASPRKGKGLYLLGESKH